VRISCALVALVLVAGCSKSVCKRAAERMVECRTMVGDLHTDPNNLAVHQGIAQLEGACDVATEHDAAAAKQMQCVADATSCEAMLACK